MSTHTNPQPEDANTYFVQDRSPERELNRQQIQGQLLTAGMGGVLPEQPDPTAFQRVLDIGCATGSWLIETARTYPTISQLVGIDVNSMMIAYAREHAEAQQVNGQVEFRIMDARHGLAFPADFFDLVNLRLGTSYLRAQDWPELLTEFQRVTRPGGVIRLTDADFIQQSSSAALNQLWKLFSVAMDNAGHLFAHDTTGFTAHLAPLLRQSGFQNVQTRLYALDYRAGTPEGRSFSEDMAHFFRSIVPFLQKWSSVPEDYEITYQQAFSDMQQPGFVVTWRLLTAWGINLPASNSD
jgi:ubiquinone/menaquinone biosynthesis C-methylase UbiE